MNYKNILPIFLSILLIPSVIAQETQIDKEISPLQQLISEIEKGIDIIRSIPTVIVQGRYDMVCPMTTAWELSQNWPEAELIIAPSSGHTAFEKEITHELISATNKFGSIND